MVIDVIRAHFVDFFDGGFELHGAGKGLGDIARSGVIGGNDQVAAGLLDRKSVV